jgi:hypothetical protein
MSSREKYRQAIEAKYELDSELLINLARKGVPPPWYLGDPVSKALYRVRIQKTRLW